MNYTLHKLPQGFIITSTDAINIGDKSLLITEGFQPQILTHFENVENDYIGRKIIAQQEQIDFSGLSEEDKKEIGWIDVEELATKHATNPGMMAYIFPDKKESFTKGFKKAQELLSDRMFTLEDMENAFFNGWIYRGDEYQFTSAKREYMKYLYRTQSWDIEMESDTKIKKIF